MDKYIIKNQSGHFTFDTENKAWSLYLNEEIKIKNADIIIEIDNLQYSCLNNITSITEEPASTDKHGRFKQITVKAAINPLKVNAETIFKIYFEHSFITASVNIINTGVDTLKLGRCMLLSNKSHDSAIYIGKPESDVNVLCETAWVLDNAVKNISSSSGIHKSKTIGLLYSPDTKKVFNCSFLTFDRADTEIIYKYSSDSLITLEVYCNFDNYELNPSCSITSETAYFELSGDPYKALEDWAQRVSDHYNPRFASQPSLGWIGAWTWRDGFSQETYEELILENVKAIKEKLNGFNIKNIWASIGNLKDMLPGNWTEENSETFPHGWPWMIDTLKKYGQSLGFWVAPFWIPDKLSNLFEDHKDNLLMKDGKYLYNNYRSPYGKSGTLPKEERVGFYSLDGSHPKTKDFLQKVFQYYNQIGIRYFMIDFLYAGSGSTPGYYIYNEYHDRTKINGPEVYREALKVIREAAGKDTYILSSTGTTFQNIGCVDAARVGPDCGEGRPLIKTMGEYPATYSMHVWRLIGIVASSMAHTYFTDRKFYYNDAFNVLTVDKPIPLEEARATVSMFGLSAGPVMLGDDIATISEERLLLLKKCLPQYSHCAKPVDLFTAIYPDTPKVFNLCISKVWDEWNVIGILNTDTSSKVWEINLNDFGLKGKDKYDLFDFWNEMYMGEITESLKIELPAQSIKLLRISKVREHPWLLSSDMHITQGGVEIDKVEWNPDKGYLKGVCTRPAGEKGNLYFKLPKGFKPLVYDGLHVAKISTDKTVIAMKRIDFNVDTVTWRIDFESTDEVVKVNYAGL